MSVCVCVPYCETVCSFLSYEDPEVALTCGVMLRECVKHEPLAKLVLDSPEFFTFFRYVEVSTFERTLLLLIHEPALGGSWVIYELAAYPYKKEQHREEDERESSSVAA